jgi:hypothetical protein
VLSCTRPPPSRATALTGPFMARENGPTLSFAAHHPSNSPRTGDRVLLYGLCCQASTATDFLNLLVMEGLHRLEKRLSKIDFELG